MEPVDTTVASVGASPGEGVGATLRARRVELGLSHADVAHMVKLPPRRIDAMEQERWGELPDGPYLRGFLRNIARALDLDAATLIAGVDAAQAHPGRSDSGRVRPGVTKVTLPRRSGPADDRRSGKALYGAFVFALVAALIAWSGTDSFDRTLVAVRAMIDPPADAPTAPPEDSADRATWPDAAAALAATAPGEAARGLLQPMVSAPTAAESIASSALALMFHFNEDAWVEVRAADGTVLLKQLNAAGSEQQIDGDPPFSVIVGNAKGVALRFRGQPVDLAPYTRDSVARFKLS